MPVAATALRVLVVEDDELTAMQLTMLLSQLGYYVVGPAASMAEALALAGREAPDVALLDVHLGGNPAHDGVALARQLLQQQGPLPLLFLTAAADPATFARARAVGPFAYLIKPPDAGALQRALELALLQFARPQEAALPEWTADVLARDSFFLKDGPRLVKVPQRRVACIQAEGNYVVLFAVDGPRYVLRQSLRELLKALPPAQFVQVHRAWVVNAECIEQVDAGRSVLRAAGREVPIGPSFREALLGRLRTLG
jgi:DNA-binding LytR/AlgR family response regulator